MTGPPRRRSSTLKFNVNKALDSRIENPRLVKFSVAEMTELREQLADHLYRYV